MVRVDRQVHRLLAIIGDRALLVHVRTHAIYLVRDDRGDIALPDRKTWQGMLMLGRLQVLDEPETSIDAQAAGPGAKLQMELDLLDRAGVPLGVKAMSIWLAAHWSEDLNQAWGHHTNVHTLKRWRTFRRRSTEADVRC